MREMSHPVARTMWGSNRRHQRDVGRRPGALQLLALAEDERQALVSGQIVGIV
jgi:hypothetical protein